MSNKKIDTIKVKETIQRELNLEYSETTILKVLETLRTQWTDKQLIIRSNDFSPWYRVGILESGVGAINFPKEARGQKFSDIVFGIITYYTAI